MMKLFLITTLTIAIMSAQCQAQKPNVILIMTDDQGWYDAGFNGNKNIKTPHMDALAAKGIIFDRFYSGSAVCSPTRASLVTGRNPLRTNIPYANSGHLRKGEITIPELLKKEGYITGHFGKWHLGTLTKTEPDANRGGKKQFENEYTIPSEHGYDYFFCTESKVPTYDPMLKPKLFQEGESLSYGWRAIESEDATEAYGTAYWIAAGQKESKNLKGDDARVIMDRVIPFIEKSVEQKQAFFSTIWFHTPHLPVVSDSAHRSLYSDLDLQTQIYYGTISALDEQIGRLWKALEQQGIQENTVIFFCSDNGPERGTPGLAGEFRERKRSLYEGGVRVPAFAVWPKEFAAGKRIDFPAVTSDYLPTLLDILNVKYPDNRPVDGQSILPALKGEVQKREKPIGFICRPYTSWVTHQYKLIQGKNNGPFELYDLIKDRSEKENIINTHPQIAQQLQSELEAWLASVERSKEGKDYK